MTKPPEHQRGEQARSLCSQLLFVGLIALYRRRRSEILRHTSPFANLTFLFFLIAPLIFAHARRTLALPMSGHAGVLYLSCRSAGAPGQVRRFIGRTGSCARH
jgi:hypothetical protein